MARSKRQYDISKHVSPSAAIVGGLIVLIILTLVGVKYAGFGSFLKTQAVPDSSGFTFENADGTPLTEEECEESYDTCNDATDILYERCNDQANEEFDRCIEEANLEGNSTGWHCDDQYDYDVHQCEIENRYRPTMCDEALEECIERAQSTPAPTATSSPSPGPDEDPFADPTPSPEAVFLDDLFPTVPPASFPRP